MIDVGIKLCDEIKQGTAKNNTDNLNAIIGLYNAIKAWLITLEGAKVPSFNMQG